MTGPAGRLRLLDLLLPAVLVAGCASLPTSGPVKEGTGADPSTSSALFDFNPSGPNAGATPDEVVSGFLSALQATPVSTRVASEYLTPQAAEAWRPDRSTIVYGAQRTTSSGPIVGVQLKDAFRLDGRGRWRGPWHGSNGGRLELRLAQDHGEWRIADPPDAMVVPRTHFEARFQEYSLFFYDPSGSVLVPEPVYLPRGVQAPTQLVSGLLQGPPAGTQEVERSYFPRGTHLDVGVPIGPNGVARVALSEQVLDLDEADLARAAGQIAWTLGQLHDVTAFQIVVDGNAVEMPGGGTVVDVDSFSNLDPAVSSASPDLFGLRGRGVVQVVGEQEVAATSVPPAWAARIGRPRSLGVDMASQRFAMVGSTGSDVLVVGRSEVRHPRLVYSGTDLLRPMWDRTGDLWLVDRTRSGSRVVVTAHGRAEVLHRWSLPGGRVRAAAMSRDGSRLVVAQRDAGGFRLRVFRVVRDGDGRPARLQAPTDLTGPTGLRRPVQVGWRDPTTVAVLTRPTATTTRLLLFSCDGASELAGFQPSVDTLFDRGTGLAASPGGPMALFVAAHGGQIHALSAAGRWEFDAVDAGIRAPTFVG